MDAKEFISRVKEDGVKFTSLQFTDVVGSVKSVDITTERLPSRWKMASGLTALPLKDLHVFKKATCGLC